MATKATTQLCSDCTATDVSDGRIMLCPLHAAAPEMLVILKGVLEDWGDCQCYATPPGESCTTCELRALLARIEGRTIPHAGTWITPEDAKRISEDGP